MIYELNYSKTVTLFRLLKTHYLLKGLRTMFRSIAISYAAATSKEISVTPN